ncbi:MAG: Mrp/NBP35 family ATP-binding protein [Bacteroidota bacterium]
MRHIPERAAVLQALSSVIDPDLGQDIVTLGMVQSVGLAPGNVRFTLVLTTPACPLQEVLKAACITAIQKHIDPGCAVDIQTTAQVTTQRQNEPLLPEVKNVIAIASGKGGVGKSTVAVNMALVLAQHGARVGLLDADIYGPSIPTMLGCTEKPHVMQEGDKKYLIPLEKYGIKMLSMGLLMPAEDAVVWRGPMASTALRQFLRDTAWYALDYLLIDLPPGTGDIHLTLVQAIPLTGAVIVTTPQQVALADARKSIAMLQKPTIQVPVLGVVENMAYFALPGGSQERYYLFGQGGGAWLAKHYQLPLLGQIPLLEDIRSGGDAGTPAVLASGAASAIFNPIVMSVAQQVAIRNALR